MKTRLDPLFWAIGLLIYIIFVLIIVIFFGRGRSLKDDEMDR